MITKKNYRIVTYKQAFEDVLGIDFDEKNTEICKRIRRRWTHRKKAYHLQYGELKKHY